MPSSDKSSYLIVGSGVFGISTAYYLSLQYPEASITVVDRSSEFPCPLAASHDFNKIIRADYGNPFYCALALEARKLWKSDPLYSSFYHESGLLNLDDTGLGKRILENYENLKEYSRASIITPSDVKELHGGLFADADLRGVDDIFYNPTSGWAEATSALGAVVEASIARGVKFVSGNSEKLSFNDDGDCTGIQCSDGSVSIIFVITLGYCKSYFKNADVNC
jgi:sarcosine oxidase/L-pipecolate oxidase